MAFEYFYGSESEQFTFFRIPKLLMTSPVFKELSDSAKLLYGLMLDRMSLSIRNGWIDNMNRAYIFFTVQDVTEIMHCGTEKATKLFAELDSEKGIGLIERKKQGQGKPAIIYLKKFTSISKDENQELGKPKKQNFEKQSARLSESRSQDFGKSKCNNNKNNNTELNDIEINQSSQNIPCKENRGSEREQTERWIDRYNKKIMQIKDQVDYETLCHSYDKGIVDNCINIMAEVLMVDVEYYTVEGKKYPGDLIKLHIGNVDYAALDTSLLHFEKRTEKIYNMKSYLITSLFNTVTTASAQMHNTVTHDMYGKKEE